MPESVSLILLNGIARKEAFAIMRGVSFTYASVAGILQLMEEIFRKVLQNFPCGFPTPDL